MPGADKQYQLNMNRGTFVVNYHNGRGQSDSRRWKWKWKVEGAGAGTSALDNSPVRYPGHVGTDMRAVDWQTILVATHVV